MQDSVLVSPENPPEQKICTGDWFYEVKHFEDCDVAVSYPVARSCTCASCNTLSTDCGRVQRDSVGAKSRVYDSRGLLLSSGKDLCDCLDGDCMGCFFPCPECESRRCGVECRCDRKWLYEQVEVEGGEIIRNKFAV
ncbi:unnamed protein product [Menidia menidia]|uniref:(Atlantic silverside) hypothetical protein n=1 Tax=Menidia menidia TaxID=238744 RepID=A0A8S4AJ85_9TELE|nr:unnamed protein product [Menidia menidia]